MKIAGRASVAPRLSYNGAQAETKDAGVIRVDIQRITETDAASDYPASAWFAAMPRKGDVVHLRNGASHTLEPRLVIGVNYIESEPEIFQPVLVLE